MWSAYQVVLSAYNRLIQLYIPRLFVAQDLVIPKLETNASEMLKYLVIGQFLRLLMIVDFFDYFLGLIGVVASYITIYEPFKCLMMAIKTIICLVSLERLGTTPNSANSKDLRSLI